jgi:hypothetical protein
VGFRPSPICNGIPTLLSIHPRGRGRVVDHIVGIGFDRDADGSRSAVIDLANGGKSVVYAAEEF